MTSSESSSVSIYSNLKLYISDETYTLSPANQPDQPSLIITRSNSQLSLGKIGASPAKTDRTISGIAGLLGIISLIKSDYLVLIKSARKVTNVFKTSIYTPVDFSVYPISLESNSELLENSDERYLLSLLKSHLDNSNGKMFYSYDSKINQNDPEPWDITSRLQKQSVPSYDKSIPLWKRADDRFFWNKHLQSKLIELAQQPDSQAVNRFILPTIFGFLEFKTTSINEKKFNFGIISRRSRFRVGTRYFSRGIDTNGEVSNFNETEMLFYTVSSSNFSQQNNKTNVVKKGSFVQTRGSVPLFWTEINNLRYRPDLKIMELPQTQDCIKSHFDKQIEIYGDQYLVNLVNSSGYERAVKEAYENNVRALGNNRVHYIYFDFHHECKGLRFDRVQTLIDQLEEDLINNQGYFYQENDSSILKQQTSIVRTNCMDCLDRTNVVQSALAKWTLTIQLKQAGILGENEVLDSHPQFMSLFRNLWADNADIVSKAYSGTGALKTDFTRLGIRTKSGALNDFLNSLKRYIKNNFLDGDRQDSYDLFLGSWNVNEIERKRGKLIEREFDLKLIRNNPIHQAILFTFIIFSLIFISATFTQKRSLKLSMISFTINVICLVWIFSHGREFVNLPRLKSREDLLNYDGVGHQSSKHGVGLFGTDHHHHHHLDHHHHQFGSSGDHLSPLDEKKKRLD